MGRNRPSLQDTAGNDGALVVHEAAITTGATGALTWAMTAPTATMGGTVVVSSAGEVASGPVTLGTATETDTAQPLNVRVQLGVATETDTPQPEDPYGIAKLAVEMDLKTTHEMFGLDFVIFRPHNVYGEYQNLGDKYRNVVGIFMNQLMQGKPLTIFGDGLQTRAFSYIGDVAPHIARSVDVPAAYNQIINIGADRDYSVKELAEAVQRVMGLTGMVRHVEARNEVVHAYADHSKAHALFGAGERFSLDEGLAKMAAWAQVAGVRKSARFKAIEITQKLPPLWLED
jgi:UDP-glucose 4-epimerase